MQPRIPRLVMVAPMVAVLAVTVAAHGGSARSGFDTPALKSISSRLDGSISTVLIEASEPVAYLTSQPDPLTVLVDLRNVNAAGVDADAIPSQLAPIAGVRLEDANAPDGSPVTRVRVRLDRAAKHWVRSARNLILVEVDRAGVSGAAGAAGASGAPQLRNIVTAPEAPAAARAGARVAAATELRAIRTDEMPNGYAITLSGNGPLVASSVEEAQDLPPRVLLDFRNVAAGRVPPVTSVNHADIQRVRVGVNTREPLITRVVIDLARMLPYTVESVGEELRVMFNRAVSATAEVAPVSAPAPARTPEVAPRLEEGASSRSGQAAVAPVVAATAPAAAAASPLVAAAQAPAPQAPAPPATTMQNPTLLGAGQTQQRQFTGDPVTLDFQGADLRAVLRTFAEISNGLNIVIDPAITGTVDVSLRDVPWDQALDIILRANKLGYLVDGNIVRIVPLTVLAQEREEQRKLAEATALAGDLRVLTRPLSYAKALDLVPIITRSALSSRGDVQIDARTNTLIIRDLADRLTAAAELVTALDRPQPQVEIEARIVTTTRQFAQALGVQWGFNGRVDPTVGTSTGLTFPNSGALDAATGGLTPAATSAVGLVLGSINGALNLDVALTALESSGRGRLLSTPRVSTQNNVEAEITQGTQIPIQTVSNNTVTIAWKDAALTLRVTPQITASNTVIMKIAVENASANFGRSVNGIPPIDTQRAVTTVLVGDGDTTVIGGIYSTTDTSTEGRTPMLHRIPLLGWLFKQNDTSTTAQELLIFITPRISSR